MATGGAAAVAALEMPGFREDHVGAFPVEVFTLFRCRAWSELLSLVSHDRERAARGRLSANGVSSRDVGTSTGAGLIAVLISETKWPPRSCTVRPAVAAGRSPGTTMPTRLAGSAAASVTVAATSPACAFRARTRPPGGAQTAHPGSRRQSGRRARCRALPGGGACRAVRASGAWWFRARADRGRRCHSARGGRERRIRSPARAVWLRLWRSAL